MPTQLLPRRVLIQLARQIYDWNKRSLDLIGRDTNKIFMIAFELEPGWVVPDDHIKGLKQLQDFIPSIKKVHLAGDANRIELLVDQENLPKELISFTKKSNDMKRLVSKDESGNYFFRGKEMFPKEKGSTYWSIFTAIYDAAMKHPLSGDDLYFADYKDIKSELVKKGARIGEKQITVKYVEISELKEFVRRFVYNDFRVRPHSLCLPSSRFNGIEILSFERGTGVKLYNPEL